uniref:Uncharacterized protein n=1 Tax=Anguilla anguilla TaxID=7936 RepID=A0A0E9RL96_ANGAN
MSPDGLHKMKRVRHSSQSGKIL